MKDISKKGAGQVQMLSWFDDFWQSYTPLTFEKRKFSVPIHYLPNGCTYSTQIKDMDMS
jgi:hypothetical protein